MPTGLELLDTVMLLGVANTDEKLPRGTLKLLTLGVFTPGRFPKPALANCAGACCEIGLATVTWL